MKIAVVQRGIEDEDLRRHLIMHARLAPFDISFGARGDMARDSAVYKEKEKGKGNKKGTDQGKRKDKDKVIIYFSDSSRQEDTSLPCWLKAATEYWDAE